MNLYPHGAQLAAYLLASAVLSAAPGPDMALFLQKTLTGGRAHGFLALAGVMTGALVHTCAAALGLSALIAASAHLYAALRLVGAFYLLYLAYAAVKRGSALKFSATAATPSGLLETYAAGVLINLTNPKVILFYVTFLPQFITPGETQAPARFLALGLGFIVISTFVNALVIAAASGFVAAIRRRPGAVRGVDYLIAAAMSGFAARLLWSSSR
ncbi:MAG: LysE family translocator [Roseiarcus sp.]